MTLYETLVFVHIVMVAVWVGGGVVTQHFASLILREGDPVRIGGFGRDIAWIATRITLPAAVVLLGSGLWAAQEGNWDFGAAWISISFTVWIVAVVAGLVLVRPEYGRIQSLLPTIGTDGEAVAQRLRRILLFSRIELVLLLIAVWAMVVKPGM
jgi:uncharacterized membrane protein